MSAEVTPDELAACRQAIERRPEHVPEAGRLPEVWRGAGGREARVIYLNFIDPTALPVGAIYRTWVVQLREGRVAAVSYFLSRRGAAGDETLPPGAV